MKQGLANNRGRPHVHQHGVAPAPADGALPLEAVVLWQRWAGQGKGENWGAEVGRAGQGKGGNGEAEVGRAGEGRERGGRGGQGGGRDMGQGGGRGMAHPGPSVFQSTWNATPGPAHCLDVCHTSIETIERENHL